MSEPHNEKLIEEIETWQLLAEAIPRGESDNVAALLRRRGVECSGQAVRSWRNDPDVHENDLADPHGRRNPLDHFLLFLTAVHARSTDGAEMVVKRVNFELARLQAIHGHEELLRAQQSMKEARDLAKRILAITDMNGGGR